MAKKEKNKSEDKKDTVYGCGCVLIVAILILFGVMTGIRSCNRQSIENADRQDKIEQSKKNKEYSISSSKEAKAEAKTDKKTKKVNKLVASDLSKFRKKSADDDAFAWSVFIQKATYDGTDATVYVINDFSKLSNSERFEVANHIQNEITAAADLYHVLGDSTEESGIFITFYEGNTRIGRSKISNNRQYKWLDEK